MISKAFRGEMWTNTHPNIMREVVRVDEFEVGGKVGHDSFSESGAFESMLGNKILAIKCEMGNPCYILG